MSVEQQIREYILENYLFTDDQSSLDNADSFLEKGILDSTGILEVIYFIEEEFEVKVEDDEMIPENLDSVNNIVAFVARKEKNCLIFMNDTLIQSLYESTMRFPDKDAIVLGNQSISYKNLWEKACGISLYLVNNGFNSGDHVSILLENSPDYVSAYYGVLMAGGTVVGLNTAAKARDLANWITHSESKFLIANARHQELPDVLNILTEQSISSIFIGNNETLDIVDDWNNIQSANAPSDNVNSIDPTSTLASIIYTSGTTGQPKGVMLSHQNLFENTKSILAYLDLNDKDSIVNVLPFYYSYGNSVLHIHLAVGGTIYLENSMLYPQKVIGLISEMKVTGFSGVPSTFNLLLSRVKLSDFDLSTVRYMTQAGGPMAPANIKRLKLELPHVDFIVMYGQTEASARLSYLPSSMLEEKAGSIGIAIPGVELKVVSDPKESSNSRPSGEIHARGKNIMIGYWNDKDATDRVLVDGWLKTGDLAYQDDDGYFYIVGRSSEMIKSGAHRISPKDIEEVILEIDAVEEAAVIGVADELLGQVLKVFIVKSPNSELDKMQIMRHCKMNLANYKLPKHIEFADEIPRTASGKVRRFMLQ